MKILFSVTLLVLAIAVGGMTYLSSKQDHLTGEPHVIVKIAVPPKSFFEEPKPQAAVEAPAPAVNASNNPPGEIDPGKALLAEQPPPVPAPDVASASSGPAEIVPGLAVDGINEQVPMPSSDIKAAIAAPKPAATPAVSAKAATAKSKLVKPVVPAAN